MPKMDKQRKLCRRCSTIKPFSAFGKNKARSGSVTAWCRPCFYLYNRDRIDVKRNEINQIKLKHGCSRCGYKEHPAALDFDHLPGTRKSGQVSMMLTCSQKRIDAEIAKCQILCSNCHKIITYERRRNGDQVSI